MLDEETDEERQYSLLWLYDRLLEVRRPARTPATILRLARQGSPTLRINALMPAAHIADPPVIELLIKLIQAPPNDDVDDPTGTEQLRRAAMWAAGRTFDTRVRRILELHLSGQADVDRGRAAVESIGHISVDADIELLRRVGKQARGPGVLRAVRRAVEQVRALQPPDRERNLIRQVEFRNLGALADRRRFRWDQWALEQIVRLRLTQLAGRLRAIHDLELERKKLPDKAFRVRLLAAILRLGGEVSAGERAALRQAGYID